MRLAVLWECPSFCKCDITHAILCNALKRIWVRKTIHMLDCALMNRFHCLRHLHQQSYCKIQDHFAELHPRLWAYAVLHVAYLLQAPLLPSNFFQAGCRSPGLEPPHFCESLLHQMHPHHLCYRFVRDFLLIVKAAPSLQEIAWLSLPGMGDLSSPYNQRP